MHPISRAINRRKKSPWPLLLDLSLAESRNRTANSGPQFRRWQPVRKKTSVPKNRSPSLRELVQEIETLSHEDLQSRAIAILKMKNRLSGSDAKRVENAFASRMVPHSALSEALTMDQSYSGPLSLQPQPPPASVGSIETPRSSGRARRIKPSGKQIAVPLAVSTSNDKIDKSLLTFGEVRRHRDKAHLKFVASQPCLVCGKSPADAHHLRFTQPRALGRKVSDEFTVPLCRAHHRDNHRYGDEVAWWSRRAIDPVESSRQFWTSTRHIQ